MRIMKFAVLAIPVFCLFTAVGSVSSQADEETTRAREVVAVVNGEEIYLEELEEAVAARHRCMSEDNPVAWVGFERALNRLIDSRLLVQEALDVGLDERPEIRENIRRFSDRTLVKLLQEKLLREVKADEDDIERIYRDEVRRWKFKAIVFGDFDQASAFRGEMKEGGDFEAVGEKYVQEGVAAWEGAELEVREAEIAPEINAAFLGKEAGSVTQVITAAGRFFVFKLTEVSYPDDPASRRRAVRKALTLKRKEVISEHTDGLLNKYATIDRDILTTIGKGDFTDVEGDSRVVAEISGEDPVLVFDLLGHLQKESYHGGEVLEHRETLASKAESVLKDALEETLYLKEARLLEIDRTDRYRETVAAYKKSLVFGMYIEEFLAPQARLKDEEVRDAYEARTEEFLMPQTVRVQSLTFTEEDSARKALESLNRGTDLKWLSRNARGLKENGIADEELTLESLPQDMEGHLSGAAPGDTGLYEPEKGTYKVFVVRELPPRAREPFEKVRPVIAKELFGERMNQVIGELLAELREISEITIYEDKLDKGPLPQDRDVN